jgi:MFS family permease
MQMADNEQKQNKILHLIPITVIFLLFLGLLSFTGYLNTVGLSMELSNQATAVLAFESKDSIDAALAAGSTLEQYTEYGTITDSLMAQEKAIQRVEVRDLNNKLIFEYAQEKNVLTSTAFDQAPFRLIESGYTQAETDNAFLLTFPLNNQSRIEGSFHLIISKSITENALFNSFISIWLACGGALLLFSVFLFFLLRAPSTAIKIVITVIWCVCFLALSGYITYNMYNLSEERVHQRLDFIIQALYRKINNKLNQNVDADSLRSALHILNGYKKKDPDISYISLMNNGTELLHTAQDQSEPPLLGDDHYNIVSKKLTTHSEDSGMELTLMMAVRKLLPVEKLFRYAKNLLIILAASMVLSISFLNLVWAARKRKELMSLEDAHQKQRSPSVQLVFPLFLLIIFCEGLLVSFLPMFIKAVVTKARLHHIMTSVIFSASFAGFCLSLIPARTIARRTGLKALITAGSLFMAAGYFTIAFLSEYYYIISARALTGMGQGIIFISLLTLYNRRSSEQEKSKKTNYIPFAFAWGMLIGITSGALLTVYISLNEIFILAGSMGALIFVYSILFIPKIEKAQGETLPSDRQIHPLKRALRTLIDGEFFKSAFFVGMIGESVVTGIILFAMPLFLKDKFNQPEIGQIIVAYFACFLAASFIASKLIRKNKHLRLFLFISTQLAGFALFALGFMNWEHIGRILPNTLATTIFITGALGLLGLSHGLLFISLIRHIFQTKSSALWNSSSLSTAFVFLASICAAACPLLIAQLLIFLNTQALVISWGGILSITGGILFISGRFTPQEAPPQKQEDIITELESDTADKIEAKDESALEENLDENLALASEENMEENLADDFDEDLEYEFEGEKEDNEEIDKNL